MAAARSAFRKSWRSLVLGRGCILVFSPQSSCDNWAEALRARLLRVHLLASSLRRAAKGSRDWEMLSNKAKYGLKALIHLAGAEGQCLAGDIAKVNNIPRKFLDAILVELRNAGILNSRKGKGGGYHLARPPEKITVGQIIRILDGPLAPIACASRTAYRRCTDCADEDACAVRDIMLDVRDSIAMILDRTSIASLRMRGNRDSALLR
jgi:Rrf2 family protein